MPADLIFYAVLFRLFILPPPLDTRFALWSAAFCGGVWLQMLPDSFGLLLIGFFALQYVHGVLCIQFGIFPVPRMLPPED